MTENNYTLTDVFVGLYNHDLINILTDEEWKFLTGLILYANHKGLINPIDLAVKQATHAGGGNSRQSVNRRRNSLKKIKIDGKPILKVTAGKPGQNVVARYDIDYDLICSYNDAWSKGNREASQKYDGSRDAKRTPSGRQADGSRDHPKIREDQRREDKVDPPKIVTIKPGIPKSTNIKRAFNDKWGIFQLSDMAVHKLLTTCTSFKGIPTGRNPEIEPGTPPEYAPLQFWFDVINRMNGKPENGINSVIEYGRKAWKNWARDHKISIFN